MKYLPRGENLVKIGPADTEKIYRYLKGFIFKVNKKKEINASKTRSPRGMHATRVLFHDLLS